MRVYMACAHIGVCVRVRVCVRQICTHIKGIRVAKMHFYRISDSLKNTFSVSVDFQNEFYVINACIIYQFVLY